MGRKAKVFPNTKYSFEEYRELALDLYHRRGYKPAQIREELGTPFWEGKQWHIDYKKSDDQFFQRQTLESKQGALGARNSRSQFVDDEVEAWAKRLDKEGKWPKGKSLAGFEAAEKRLQTLYDKEIDRLKSSGLDVSDGHIIALANENVKGTPLDAKGKGGSHSPRSRVPEMLADNKSRGANYDIPKLTARKAGIPTTSAEAFAQYLTGDQGTGVHLGTKDKQRIHIQGENPDKVIADRYKFVENKKQDSINKKLLQAKEVADKYNLTKVAKKGVRLAGVAGTAFVLTNFTGKVHAAVKEPSAKNLGLAGLATLDAGLEAAEYATGGLALPLTTLLQAGIIGAETVIEDGTAKISTANRRRYRHGNR